MKYQLAGKPPALSKQDRKIVTLAQSFTDLVPLLSKTLSQVCRIQIGCRVCPPTPPTTEADRVGVWRFVVLLASFCSFQRFCRTLSYPFKVSGWLKLRGCHL